MIHQTFKEGEKHTKPYIGDVVIKADGSKVVINATFVGNNLILGLYQGVDIITGVQAPNGVLKEY